jgi:hypothetical protein
VRLVDDAKPKPRGITETKLEQQTPTRPEADDLPCSNQQIFGKQAFNRPRAGGVGLTAPLPRVCVRDVLLVDVKIVDQLMADGVDRAPKVVILFSALRLPRRLTSKRIFAANELIPLQTIRA